MGAFLKGTVEGGGLMRDTEGKKPSSIAYTRGAAEHKGHSEEGWLDAALAGTERTRVRSRAANRARGLWLCTEQMKISSV